MSSSSASPDFLIDEETQWPFVTCDTFTICIKHRSAEECTAHTSECELCVVQYVNASDL